MSNEKVVGSQNVLEKLRDVLEDQVESNARMRMASGSVESKDPLVCLLYLLGRDHLPLGVLEEAVETAYRGGPGPASYTNGWLASYATDAAARLRERDEGKPGTCLSCRHWDKRYQVCFAHAARLVEGNIILRPGESGEVGVTNPDKFSCSEYEARKEEEVLDAKTT